LKIKTKSVAVAPATDRKRNQQIVTKADSAIDSSALAAKRQHSPGGDRSNPGGCLIAGNGKIEDIPILSIILAETLKTRAIYMREHIEALIDALRNRVELPPVVVFCDPATGKIHLADGEYRRLAHLRLNLQTIRAEIHAGDLRDAALYRFHANIAHGQSYTLAERTTNVEIMLLDPLWTNWANREIARHCGVDEGTIRNRRIKLFGPKTEGSAEFPQERQYSKNGKIRTMNTGGINANRNSKSGQVDSISLPIESGDEKLKTTQPDENYNKKIINAEIAQREWNVQPGEIIVAVSQTVPGGVQVIANLDSTDAAAVDAVCQPVGECGLIIADVPYNVDYDSKKYTSQRGGHELQKIANDNLPDDEYERFIRRMLLNCRPHLEPGSGFFVFYGFAQTDTIFTALKTTLGHPRQPIHWLKNNPRPDNSYFLTATETAFFGWTGSGNFRYWSGGKRQKNVFDARNFSISLHDLPNNTHPCRKPLSMMIDLIRFCLEPGGIVLDPVAGSAVVAVAAELTGRQSISFEIEPAFVAVAIERFVKLKLEIIRTDLSGFSGVIARIKNRETGGQSSPSGMAIAE